MFDHKGRGNSSIRADVFDHKGRGNSNIRADVLPTKDVENRT